MNKIFTLHAGSWDGHHLVGTFSSKERAELFVKFFNITDNPSIEEIQIDPMMDYITMGLSPFLVKCNKKDKSIRAELHYEHFHKDNVHFAFGTMYYFLVAKNKEEACSEGVKMRNKLIDHDWEQNYDLGKLYV